jgi:hypothetical protein
MVAIYPFLFFFACPALAAPQTARATVSRGGAGRTYPIEIAGYRHNYIFFSVTLEAVGRSVRVLSAFMRLP